MSVKIPDYMYEPVTGMEKYGLRLAARALRLDARLSRKQGASREFARALDYAAGCLAVAAGDTDCCMATAFEFPDQPVSTPHV